MLRRAAHLEFFNYKVWSHHRCGHHLAGAEGALLIALLVQLSGRFPMAAWSNVHSCGATGAISMRGFLFLSMQNLG